MSSSAATRRDGRADTPPAADDLKVEVAVIAVADVDRSKAFYEGLGWRLDADIAGDTFRVVQLTPPGSGCSIAFGRGVTQAAPGSATLEIVVSDIVAARDRLASLGVDVSEVFHGSPFDPGARISGPDPQRTSYLSYATFVDPDGNAFLLQEVTVRHPGRSDSSDTTFASTADLSGAMRRASVAHGEHEKRVGGTDENWPDWYAAYVVAEQHGRALPA